MDLIAELTAIDTPPHGLSWAENCIKELLAQTQTTEQLRAELKNRDLKIQALILELTHLRRMR
ncbi:hypothetical protein EPO05_05985 [Patescibacteria group bacterium]|nr:MAG: hypothetical protein EPO05_05985 [Patescibacteria group bacterium]